MDEGEVRNAVDSLGDVALPGELRPRPVTKLESAGVPVDSVQPAAAHQRACALQEEKQQ
jgi:hypothetical protein